MVNAVYLVVFDSLFTLISSWKEFYCSILQIETCIKSLILCTIYSKQRSTGANKGKKGRKKGRKKGKGLDKRRNRRL
jgi:hypothetical protein